MNAESSKTGSGTLCWMTALHPLVDACSFCVLLSGGMTTGRVLAYNALAFAMQLPLGMALDARSRWTPVAFFAGTAIVAAAGALCAAGWHGGATLAAACVGNALFHLAAGKHILETHGGRSMPIGLFVSTGALGLLAGRVGMERWAAGCLPLFAAALAVSTAAMAASGRGTTALSLAHGTCGERDAGGKILPWMPLCAGLFVLIAWRSWAVLATMRLTVAAGTAMLAAGTLATWSGKVAGGCLAERIGRWPVTAASACGSAAMAYACSPESATAWISLAFVAQLAAGPVVSLMYDATGRRGGAAFGANCLGLFTGSL